MNSQDTILQIKNVSKSYDEQNIIENVSLSLARGEIGCLLGPSGCGKTTLLRTIAGFEEIQSGRIEINGEVVSAAGMSRSPEKRSVGMVFQDYALFPHLSVEQNIAFGIREKPRPRQKEKVRSLLKLVGLEDALGKYPHELSGGQQQRVALARALAPEPELLLLDEPFSNLDALLRDRLTIEVRDILKKSGTTGLLVTHNQYEAFSVADKIGLLFHGKMQQWDSCHNIYHQPATAEVATFIGDGALICGRVMEAGEIECALGLLKTNISGPHKRGDEVRVLIRPEEIHCGEDGEIEARVTHKSFRGGSSLYQLKLGSGEICQTLTFAREELRVGASVKISHRLEQISCFAK
ncbi:ABC transporter ATP-binding protein [Desulfotalea psychrophila]|nr:ABC transporter ATP-binding protein [Desulfotalea psychrophila]